MPQRSTAHTYGRNAGASYPLMALVAELAFHVLPLALLLPLVSPLVRAIGRDRALWSCVVLVSLIEPVFQVAGGASASPLWVSAYVGLHVFAIDLLGLYLFTRFDFFTMYVFRVLYYAHWHILWGYLRLHLIF